jgi:hypothetical protein
MTYILSPFLGTLVNPPDNIDPDPMDGYVRVQSVACAER